MEVTNQQFVYVNSKDNLSSSVNSLQFDLTPYLQKNIKFNRVTVTQVDMPISYYLIPNGYNTFTLTENGVKTVIVIPPGNYNINSFCVIVAGLLNTNSPNHLTYTMVYDNSFNQVGNGLISYTVNSSAYPIGFIFNPLNNVSEQFGFGMGSTALFAAGKLSSKDVVNFTPENTIFIHSPMVANGSSDVIQEVYNQNNEPFSYVSWINPAPIPTAKIINRQSYSDITLTFTDENNVPIFFNGATVVLTLMFFEDLELGKKLNAYLQFLLERESGPKIERPAKPPPGIFSSNEAGKEEDGEEEKVIDLISEDEKIKNLLPLLL